MPLIFLFFFHSFFHFLGEHDMNSGDNEGTNCRMLYFTVCTVKFFSCALKIFVHVFMFRFILRVYVQSLCSGIMLKFILRIYPQNFMLSFIFKVYVPDLHSTFTFCVYSSRSRSYILRWTSSTHLPLLHFYQEYFRAGRGITRYYIQFGLHATGSFAKGGRTKIVT